DDGTLLISNLKYDTDELTEMQASQGQWLDTAPAKSTIDDTHQSFFVSQENTAIKGSVSLEKVDRDTKRLLADAEFAIQEKDGNTLKTNLKTDQKGKRTDAELLPGEYQFVET
ncbi:MSCRAMM family protein, partial [Listeria monocytogenes]|uniref:MSCRAMM family protein n=1 Tax=Listeria monocytogenes TaxID=1639 RepID=UPI000A7FDB2C